MEEYEILLVGDFGWEILYVNFVKELAEASGKDLKIKITSDGGSVVEASSMRNELASYMKKNDAKVVFEVVGWAQSAASYLITLPGTKVVVNEDSLYMYHNPMAGAFGDHTVMEERASFLRSLSETYAKGYAKKSDSAVEEITEGMRVETRLIGQAIVDAGFADEINEGGSFETEAHGENIVQMSKESVKRLSFRMHAAAIGDRDNKELAPKSAPEMKGVEMSTPKKDDVTNTPETTNVEDLQMRAKAFSSVVAANPTHAQMLQKEFDGGASADFFKGFQAHAEMQAASKSNAEAEADNPPSVEPKTQEPEEPQMTAGATGETTKV